MTDEAGAATVAAPETWAVGYLIEFDDDGGPERVVVRVCDELSAERTGRALERLGAVPYSGGRPVLTGVVFTCRASALEDEPSPGVEAEQA
jgi:hypothetical protein